MFTGLSQCDKRPGSGDEITATLLKFWSQAVGLITLSVVI